LTVCLFIGLLFSKAIKRKSEKAALALFSLTGIVCLFHTGSRACWLAFVAGIFFLGLLRKSKIIIGGLIITGIIAFFALPDYMLIHFDAYRKEQSISERFMLWERAADVIKAHPFLGVGINTYNKVHEKYDTKKDSRVKGYYAHNGYLQLGAEIGLFGLAAFVIFILLYFSKLIYRARDSIPDLLLKDSLKGVLAGCFGFLCLVMVDTVFHSYQSSLLFWLFMGLGMSLFRTGMASKTTEEDTREGIL